MYCATKGHWGIIGSFLARRSSNTARVSSEPMPCPSYFSGSLGVRQDDESLRLDVFDHGEIPAEVEFVSLFRSVVDQFVFLFHNPEF